MLVFLRGEGVGVFRFTSVQGVHAAPPSSEHNTGGQSFGCMLYLMDSPYHMPILLKLVNLLKFMSFALSSL